MYCSSCGGAILQQLTYCNHCGSKLNLAKRDEVAKPAEMSPEPLVWAIVAVFLGGTGVIIGLLAVMKNLLHFDYGPLMFFAMLTFLMMVVIESVFIWKLVGRKHRSERADPEQLTAKAKGEFGEIQPKALTEPQHSVTDQTTRSFDPVFVKRTSE